MVLRFVFELTCAFTTAYFDVQSVHTGSDDSYVKPRVYFSNNLGQEKKQDMTIPDRHDILQAAYCILNESSTSEANW